MNRFLDIIEELRAYKDRSADMNRQMSNSPRSAQTRSSHEYISPSLSQQKNAYSYQQNPLVVGGIAIADAISIGLAGVSIVQSGVQSIQGGFSLVYDKAERLLTTEARNAMPNSSNTNRYQRMLFNIPQARAGTANAVINARWQGNAYGEIGTVIFERDLSRSSDWSRSSFSITITRVNLIPNTALDPRAWPITYNYSGSYDPLGNGHWEFDGEFELNAFGGLRFNRHNVVSRSLADFAVNGSPQDWVQKGQDQSYTIPTLPADQLAYLRQHLGI